MNVKYSTNITESWNNLSARAEQATRSSRKVNSYWAGSAAGRTVPTIKDSSDLYRPSIWVCVEAESGKVLDEGKRVLDALALLAISSEQPQVDINAVGLKTEKQGLLTRHREISRFTIDATQGSYPTFMGEDDAAAASLTSAVSLEVDKDIYAEWGHDRRQAALTVVNFVARDVESILHNRQIREAGEP